MNDIVLPELPEGAQIPGVVAPVVEFDPSLIFQGIDQATALTNQGIDFASEQFGIASGFQQPFFNDAQGFQQLSGDVLGGAFDPRNNANAFTAGAGNPEFDFRLEQGINAIDSAASAAGLLNSGTRAQDLNSFAQGLSSQFSTEDLARRQAVAGQNLSNLNTLAGFEQAGANNLSNISTGLGGIGANALTGLGSNVLGALSGAAQLQNNTALSNAGFDLTAQGSNLGAFTDLLNIANRPGGGDGSSTSGTLAGIALTLLPQLIS